MTKTVSQIRAEILERRRAFAEVMRLRGKLADARNRLAADEADLAARPRQPVDTRDRHRQHVADLTFRLSEAETYCRDVNPDQLRDHDAKIAAEERAAKAAREAEEAAHLIALEEGRKAAAIAAQARFETRNRQKAEAIGIE